MTERLVIGYDPAMVDQEITIALEDVALLLAGTGSPNSRWSTDIGAAVGDLGARHGYTVHARPGFCPAAGHSEWLVDMAWVRYHLQYLESVALVLECQWDEAAGMSRPPSRHSPAPRCQSEADELPAQWLRRHALHVALTSE